MYISFFKLSFSLYRCLFQTRKNNQIRNQPRAIKITLVQLSAGVFFVCLSAATEFQTMSDRVFKTAQRSLINMAIPVVKRRLQF